MDSNITNFIYSSLISAAYGWVVLFVLFLITTIFAYTYELLKKETQSKFNEEAKEKGLLYNKNVIITGGSSGIGKCVAIEAAREGAHVTIIARNLERLAAAREEILEAARDPIGQRIECLPLDISLDYFYVERAFDSMERKHGPCYLLVNCAGTAVCAKVEDTSPDVFDLLLRLNLTATYFCTKAVVPSMKQAREGKIVLVGSQASLIGIYGFSAYASSKFAIRGFAETLAMELSPYNVSVTLSMPPDTDTPGFANEEESKPLETKIICKTGGLEQPEVVAKQLLKDALDGRFFSVVGGTSFFMKILCTGISPSSSLSDLVLEVFLMGPFRIVGVFILYTFRNIVTKCMKNREQQKKSE